MSKDEMIHNKTTEEEKEEEEEEEDDKTSVWWHINSCPIPSGYDPRLVGPTIESALKKVRRISDRISITAIGNLKDIPGGDDVLEMLLSTGISLKHTPDVISFQSDMFNRPPATVMLISGPVVLELLAPSLYDLARRGHTTLVAYSQRDSDSEWLWKSFLRSVFQKWHWESLLRDEMASESADNKQEMTRDESRMFCLLCRFACQSFEDFTTHLKCQKHEYLERDLEPPQEKNSVSKQPGADFSRPPVIAEEMSNKRKAVDEEEEEMRNMRKAEGEEEEEMRNKRNPESEEEDDPMVMVGL